MTYPQEHATGASPQPPLPVTTRRDSLASPPCALSARPPIPQPFSADARLASPRSTPEPSSAAPFVPAVRPTHRDHFPYSGPLAPPASSTPVSPPKSPQPHVYPRTSSRSSSPRRPAGSVIRSTAVAATQTSPGNSAVAIAARVDKCLSRGTAANAGTASGGDSREDADGRGSGGMRDAATSTSLDRLARERPELLSPSSYHEPRHTQMFPSLPASPPPLLPPRTPPSPVLPSPTQGHSPGTHLIACVSPSKVRCGCASLPRPGRNEGSEQVASGDTPSPKCCPCITELRPLQEGGISGAGCCLCAGCLSGTSAGAATRQDTHSGAKVPCGACPSDPCAVPAIPVGGGGAAGSSPGGRGQVHRIAPNGFEEFFGPPPPRPTVRVLGALALGIPAKCTRIESSEAAVSRGSTASAGSSDAAAPRPQPEPPPLPPRLLLHGALVTPPEPRISTAGEAAPPAPPPLPPRRPSGWAEGRQEEPVQPASRGPPECLPSVLVQATRAPQKQYFSGRSPSSGTTCCEYKLVSPQPIPPRSPTHTLALRPPALDAFLPPRISPSSPPPSVVSLSPVAPPASSPCSPPCPAHSDLSPSSHLADGSSPDAHDSAPPLPTYASTARLSPAAAHATLIMLRSVSALAVSTAAVAPGLLESRQRSDEAACGVGGRHSGDTSGPPTTEVQQR